MLAIIPGFLTGLSLIIAIGAQVIQSGQEIESIGKMKVIALIESLPGVGKVRAKSVMEKIGIAESRRIRGLGVHQIRELTAHFNLI